MEKFQTHAGPKSLDELLSEIVKKPKDKEVLIAEALVPGESSSDTVELGPLSYGVKSASELSVMKSDRAVVPTGPQGPTGPLPAPPGANGPAGPLAPSGITGTFFSSEPGLALVRERAEVELRQALRRCLKEGVELDRLVEIFRLELVEVVHDD